jgi:penicillin-binding protein 1A
MAVAWSSVLKQWLSRFDAGRRSAGVPGQVDRLLRHRSRTWIAIAAVLGLSVAGGLVGGVWMWMFAGLPRVPDVQSLWAMDRAPGVTFVSDTGEILAVRGPFYGRAVKLAELPPYVPQAFLAIEDKRFYTHRGIDRQALMRAAAANIGAGRTVQGGSTITQQLVKNLFLTPDRTIRRKVQEMILAGRIERQLRKDDILEMYLNRVYLGDQAYGVDAAARKFFGKGAAELSLPEAAMLAGLPKAPSRSAPTENFKAAKERQALVLQAMVEAGFITADDERRYTVADISVAAALPPEGDLGYALDQAIEDARRLGGKVPADLVVTLTIDPRLQREASAIVKDYAARSSSKKKPLQAALFAVDRTGAVRAMVGGTGYAQSKFNRAVQAKRQPGSTFKAFVYAAALEQGLSPDDVRYDEPITIQGWSPKNYHDGYLGAVTLRTAFAQSLNTVAAEVADEVGQTEVCGIALRMGITTPCQPVPSIALGSSEVTLHDMTQAFSVFMRDGQRIDGFLVSAVGDSRGQMIYRRERVAPQQVLPIDVVHGMTGMMGRVLQVGTGTRALLDGRDAAGKTGTSQDWRDAWFVGYTHDFTTGVWVGYDDFSPMAKITGGGPPAEIWAEFMTRAHKGIPRTPLVGIEPFVRSRRSQEVVTFYDAMTVAFGGEPPPDPTVEGPLPPSAPRP